MLPDNFLYLTILSVVQGITEFLPISSSAHLILLPRLLGVADQGIVVDMAAHLGSLIAIIWYFRTDVRTLLLEVSTVLKTRTFPSTSLTSQLMLATIPVIIIGLFFADVITSALRDPKIIAITSIMFGLLLFIADKIPRHTTDISTRQAICIGVAQAIALIPGVSRSGITMTTGRFLGLSRTTAARFSLLLSIPTTAAAIILVGQEIVTGSISVSMQTLGYVTILTAIIAYSSIGFLMRFLERHSFTPFVIYRLVLGILLLIFFW